MATAGVPVNGNKQQNLEYIKNELELLRQCCINNDSNAFRTRKAAEPFFQQMTARQTRVSVATLFKVFLALGLLALLVSNKDVQKFAVATTRQASMSVLTIWDWRKIHDAQCFIPNPLKADAGRKIEELDCEMCANLTTVTKLYGSTMEEVSEDFLKEELPVVVTTDIHLLTDGVTLDDLYQLYLEDDIVKLYACCDFDSNIEVPKKNHRLFLKRLRTGQYTSYYAHWQNCFKEAAKMFRQVYRRPDFLPTTVELSPTNWLLISSNYSQTSSVKLPVEESVVVLVQLSGVIDLILKPRAECRAQCKTLTVQLVKGSVFIVTDLLYDVEYRPARGKQAITVGLGGSFDF